ncbi:GNAT family N-acetyltransferase [Micropruina sonneratiae]|uniref:GNAT family N-acetyltransferase n=1 Tax=Micropruina sonneratiae TaxID=2986940 RepID=UPI002227F583|nr:hypothetical protein [Micropruina sp. KQZ13P-5]MCW3159429.1 hypothetical protein [Micropruina sp. KQZ13P-5]
MDGVELVSPGMVRDLACPWCGRAMPIDEAGMVAAQAAWGLCGAAARDAAGVSGLLLLSAAASGDPQGTVALVGAGWVRPDRTGRGVGRELVRAVAAALLRPRVAAVLAGSDAGGGCASLPPGFLDATGFTPMRAPGLWRLDLVTTVKVPKPSVLDRLGALVQTIRPVGPPEPARRQSIR